ncbi:hypothetical protein ACHAXA_011249 [Cyclostephanos tholiformis]|uniref:RCC1-like domain-containing protein n=1 Tax=Cyclostephanos tholiformis TaxID=382380 RepID=A0ABD3SPP4_9STRA
MSAARVVSALSILGTTTLTSAANNNINAASASAQLRVDVISDELQNRASQAHVKVEGSSTSTTASGSESEFSKEWEEVGRLLDAKSGNFDQARTPRRSLIAIGPKRRQHVKPPSDNVVPLLTTSEWSLQQPANPSKYNPNAPFYPDLVTHKCYADNKYPEHYLYHINAYFSHSLQACCESHFNGIDVKNCIKGVVYDGTIIQHYDGDTMNGMTKKEGYHLNDIGGAGEDVVGKGANVSIGKKKPLYGGGSYDTSSPNEYPAYPTTQEGGSWGNTHNTPILSLFTHNYCGTSFENANTKCGMPCPSGTDIDCTQGESCFAEANSCPAYIGMFEVGGNATKESGRNSDITGRDDAGLHSKQVRYGRRILQSDYEGYAAAFGSTAKSAKSKASKTAKSKASKTPTRDTGEPTYFYDPPFVPSYAPFGNEYSTQPPAPSYAPFGNDFSTQSPALAYAPSGNEYPTYSPTSKGSGWGGNKYSTYSPTPKGSGSGGKKYSTYSPISNGSGWSGNKYPTYSPTPKGSGWGGGWGGNKYPTYSPTPKGSGWGGGWGGNKYPTYSPTSKGSGWGGNNYPTYSPTPTGIGWGGNKYPTYSPTPKGSGWGGGLGDNIIPTNWPTWQGGTYFPTTNTPTSSLVPTTEPTAGGTTEIPTTEGTMGPPLDLLVWGSSLSISQPEEDGNILIPVDTDIVAIDASAGTKYSLVIYPDGRAFSAGFISDPKGDDYHGHLGIRPEVLVEGQNMWNEIDRVFDSGRGGLTFPPRFKKGFAGVENTEGTGDIHTILLDGKGNAWATGSNDAGQLCLGDTLDKLIPQLIPVKNIVDVAIGGRHTLLLDSDGTVYGCGSNEMGQLGLAATVESTPIPLKVYLLQVPASSVSAGKDHSLIIAEDGNYVMGSNTYGQLCVDTQGENVFTPSAIDVEEKVVTAFEATRESSYVLYIDGSVNSCGRNNFGQLGDGTEEDAFLVTVAVPKEDKVVRLLGAGPSSYSAFFVSDNEKVFGTGLNNHGQLGVGDEQNRNVPTLVKLQDEVKVFVLSSAEDHSLTLKEGGVESTKDPTFAPSGDYPTFAPTSEPIETPTKAPSSSPITMIPTNSPMTMVPTNSPTTMVPTNSPTAERISTYNPTLSQTFSPTQAGSEYFFWGAPEAVGEPIDAPDVNTPLNVGSGVIDSGAGTKYTILILKDGSTLAAGYIEDIDNYQGHLGVDQNVVVQGVNEFHLIDQVYDHVTARQDNVTMALVDAPRFEKAFLGVENTPNTGAIHTILLDEDGNAWATGNNLVGQLCLGDNVDRMIPEKIPMEGKVLDVAIGGEHTLLLLENGSVYGCGSNAKGQLGLGEKQTVSSPTKLSDLSSIVTSVSAGHSHSLFMATDGIYLSGSNEYGQICVDTSGKNVLTPTALQIDERVAIAFESIKESTFILYEDGSVNACGRNNFGQLGDGTNEDQFITTVQTNGTVTKFLGVGPSAQSVFFITSEDTVLSSGLNDRGQLGVGDFNDRNLPTRVKFEGLVSIIQLYVSEIHSVAVGTTIGTLFPTAAPSVFVPATSSPTRQGKNMYFWGAPDSIGETETEDILIPFESGNNVIDASGGSKYTVIVLNDGTALSAGYIDSLENYQGHLGRGASPDVVQGVNEMMSISLVYDSINLAIIDAPKFDKVYAGVENSPGSGVIHTILLDVQGHAWATGSNEKGQLCLGDNVTMVVIPEKIPIEGKIVDVAIGGEHTLLVDEFGNVYGCGSNVVGQLGLGTIEKTSLPIMVDGLASVTSVSAGHSHSVFMSDNGIYFTGSNEFGQLCEDTNGENVLTPGTIDIPGIESATHFEAIKSSSYILYTDGSASGCGNNEFGQLGDGTDFDRILSLVQLDGVAKFLGVGPSAESVFFVTDDDRVWATGLNDRGQLGTGDTENRNLPTPVKFEERVILEVLSAAGDQTVAIGSSDGTFEPTTSPSVFSTVKKTSSPTILPEFQSMSPTSSQTVSPTLRLTTVAPTTEFQSMSPTSSLTASPTLQLTTVAPTIAGTPAPEPDVYYWGSSGSIGESPSDEILAPLKSGIRAADLSAGSNYTIVVYSDGSAQSGGYIDSLDIYHGHLGTGLNVTAGVNPLKTITDVFDADNELIIVAPMFVKAFAGAEEISSLGSIHSLLIDKDGQAWVTGSNNKGQLCLGDTDDRLIPQRVPIDTKVENAAIGAEHTLLLLEDGTVYGCGSNEAGQLGLGDYEDPITTPTIIEGLSAVESLSAGLDFSLFMATDGLYVTGSNLYGQLCVNDTLGGSLNTPILIEDVDVAVVSFFYATKASSFILFNDGTVGACGRNEFGQLGDGNNTDRVRTVVVPHPNGLPVTMMSFGPSAESVFFVTEDDRVWGTGLNNLGQLGVGDTEDRNKPTPLMFEDRVKIEVLSAAGDHTVAVGLSDGTFEPTTSPTASPTTSSPTVLPTLATSIDPTLPLDTSMLPSIAFVSILPTIPGSASPTAPISSLPTIPVSPSPTTLGASTTPPDAMVSIIPTTPVSANTRLAKPDSLGES